LTSLPPNARGRKREIKALNIELKNLISQQSEARRTAVFRGMTPSDSRDYDARHDKILALKQQLNDLEL